MGLGISPLDIGSLALGGAQVKVGYDQTQKDNLQNALALWGNIQLARGDADAMFKTQAATGDILNKQYAYALPEFQRNESNLDTLNANRWGAYDTGLNTNYNNAMNALGSNETALRGDLDNQVGTVMGGVDKLRNQVMGGYTQQRNDVMGLLDNLGNAAKQDVRDNWVAQGAKTQQALTDSGLGNTTIGAQMAMANTSGMNRDLGSLDENLRSQKAGMLERLTSQGLAAQMNMGQYGSDMQSNLLGNRLSMLANAADTNWGRRTDLGQNLVDARNAMGLEQAQVADAQSQARQAFARQYSQDYRDQLNNNYAQIDSLSRNIQPQPSQNTGLAMTMQGYGALSNTFDSIAARNQAEAAARQQASATKTAGALGFAGAFVPSVGFGAYKKY